MFLFLGGIQDIVLFFGARFQHVAHGPECAQAGGLCFRYRGEYRGEPGTNLHAFQCQK